MKNFKQTTMRDYLAFPPSKISESLKSSHLQNALMDMSKTIGDMNKEIPENTTLMISGTAPQKLFQDALKVSVTPPASIPVMNIASSCVNKKSGNTKVWIYIGIGLFIIGGVSIICYRYITKEERNKKNNDKNEDKLN